MMTTYEFVSVMIQACILLLTLIGLLVAIMVHFVDHRRNK